MSNLSNPDQFISRIERELSALNLAQEPAALYDPIRYILSNGGKRARPTLVMLACGIFSDDIEAAIPPALAVEIFHNFTLVHDDIMDEAPMRRNQPTVHEKWGNSIAILSGDAMMIKAYDELMKCDSNYLARLIGVFNKAALHVCEGQQMDMNFENRDQVSIDEYVRMIELKTSTLLAASLKMGAIAGGASDEQANTLGKFGKNIGIAFQLQDDILDVYGEEGKFGKQVGGDILAGKKTFLLLKALEIGEPEVERELVELVEGTGSSEVQVTSTRKIFDKLQIKEIALKEVKKYHDLGMGHLDSVQADESKKQSLKDMAERLLNREI